ncbi:MAG TPA: hemerythrin domain-containing protein [Candidatus Kapabacteria bacterium]|nr:hemerythrin domain-containing protein [Candidatus Kapabacteria bacterium]
MNVETNPVKQLLAEHDAFRASCDELQRVVHRLEHDGYRAVIGTSDYATLLRTREVIREHLNVHLVKEEQVFFPRLEAIVPQGRIKFLFLNYDHEFLRVYFDEFCKIVSDFEDDRVPMHVTVKRVIEVGSHIITNLLQHILTEDSVYFEVAENGFDQKTLDEMGREMKELEFKLKEQTAPID